ncbi:SpoIIE family protein phosphatase [Romboutsia sp.]|uniref:SpoIIE family protein phosphatase n=1 Tax=Romboutsia sp. TaxID=1965302 RepID=UPI002B6D8081|nr:SpoIIE family protein phosphatase [Romboutsia sp.]HSQ87377.1 SpoIIE family protein phosphatase [Romboutsia sp.]
MRNSNNDSYKMKNLVDISAMVTESTDFFSIKDKIVEKMLEVVHPTKACVNLFYKNNYQHAYLVCSKTLEYIPQVFPMNSPRGVKIDFNEYPKYVHEAVKEKKKVYIENVFNDERAEQERELAKAEGYIGRIVFPFIINNVVVGFMTCFLTEEDYLTEQDIDFISSVSSLISLSIEITTKNNNTQLLIHKLRGAISSINEATKKLYLNKNINGFLEHLSKQACNITNSKEAIIIINEQEYRNRLFNCYNSGDKKQINVYPIIESIVSQDSMGSYSNNIKINCKDGSKLESYIYYKLKDKNEVIGCIVCANSQNYTNDDLNILSILAKQVSVAMQLYEYNIEEVKHKVLANELNLLNKQQKLIMDKGKMECNDQKELSYYHKPARVVGGDFYYAMRVDEDRIVYIVADVMGHGMVSNYVVAIIKGAFKVLCHQYKTPSEIMTNLNKMLYDEFDKMGVFTTCLISMINTKSNTITISNAGHYSPIIIKKDGTLVSDLNCIKGIPIGIMEDAEYVDNTQEIEEYSMVCMYTDGILEIKNELKQEYGISKLEKFLQHNFRFSQQKIVENLKLQLKEFAGKNNYDDDILVVMLKDKQGG